MVFGVGGDTETPTGELLEFMRKEKVAYIKKLEAGTKMKKTRCALCPNRSFDRVARALHHVKKYHTKRRNYAPAGTKQLKVAQAIFDNDCITGAGKGNYLARSGKVLKQALGRA